MSKPTVTKPAPSLSSRGRRSFSDLPDDVFLLLFLCMDFPSIIALRQTCRKLYHASKSTSLWLTLYRRITNDTEDWRIRLAGKLPPLSELEKRVTRIVMFERHWSKGAKGIRKSTTFKAAFGYVDSLLVPGGRWLLGSRDAGVRGVIYYDLDSPNIRDRLLIKQEQQDYSIHDIDFAVDGHASKLKLNLAIFSVSEDNWSPRHPKNLEVWRVSVDGADALRARNIYSIKVFRGSPMTAISLSGNFVLRISLTEDIRPVFTLHQWKASRSGRITSSILLPDQRKPPSSFILLPDARIACLWKSAIELYPTPTITWSESYDIPEGLTRSKPQWVYELASPVRLWPIMTPILHSQQGGWVRFSVRSDLNLFEVRIPLHVSSDPKVAVHTLPMEKERSKLGLGTSHGAFSSDGKQEGVLLSLDFRPGVQALKAFAGLPAASKPTPIVETTFIRSFYTHSYWWRIDEESGRIVGLIGRDKCAVFSFLD